MTAQTDLLIDLMNTEFDGDSFNGPSLLRTLRGLTLEQALATDTYEGYSAWGVALHVAFWKYELARRLGAEDLPPFPYEATNWPALPELPTEAAWLEMLQALEGMHRRLMGIVATYDQALVEREMPEWGVPFGKALIWIATHDTYHTAQIRNMGLRGLPVTPP